MPCEFMQYMALIGQVILMLIDDTVVPRHGSSLDRWTRVTDPGPEFWETDAKVGNDDTYKEEIESVNSYFGT